VGGAELGAQSRDDGLGLEGQHTGRGLCEAPIGARSLHQMEVRVRGYATAQQASETARPAA